MHVEDVISAALGKHGGFCIAGDLLIEASAADNKGPRRFRGLLYNGGPIKVKGYPVPVVVDLAGIYGTDKGRPMYCEHDEERLVGHYDTFENNGRTLAVAGAFSVPGEDSARVLKAHDDGFPWKQSIEAMPEKSFIEPVQSGQTVQVNGRQIAGPVLVARRSRLIGGSVVARGADDDTTIKIAASAANPKQVEGVAMKFLQWVEALHLDAAQLTDQQTVALRAKFDAEEAAAIKGGLATGGTVDPSIPIFDVEEIRASYSDHMAAIEAEFSEHDGKIGAKAFAEIRTKATETARGLRTKALKEKTPAVVFESELIKAAADVRVSLARAERPKGPAIHSATADFEPVAIEAALCINAGLPSLEKAFKPEALDAGHALNRRYGNLGLQGAIIMAAQSNGYANPVHRITTGNARELLSYAFPIRASFSPVSLPGIFSNVGGKFLVDGFGDVEQVWREFAAIRNVSDFKTVTSYRLLDDMAYEQLGPAGEIKPGKVSEESYTNKAKTYAKLFSLTFEDIKNDDMGAWDSLRSRLGRGHGLKLNRVFWASYLDDAEFFTEARGNLINLAIGASGIAAAVLALDSRKDNANNPIDVGGQQILLVPSALEPTAKTWYVSQEIRDTTTSTKAPTTNIYQNTYRPVKSRYLTAPASWYLVPVRAGDMAPMEVCFLDGVETPVIESAEADFSTLGVQFRGYGHFGVVKKEWRTSVKSTGGV